MTRRTLLQHMALLPLASETGALTGALQSPALAFREVAPRKPLVQDGINWPQFMARHDLTWEQMPARWEEGAFVGNGLLGAMIFASDDGRALRFHIGRSDVADKGQRLPLGDLLLQPQGRITACTLRLDLWNAQARGQVTTDKGALSWQCSAHAFNQIIVIEWQPSEGETGATWA